MKPMFVKLTGVTKKGKERVKQHGNVWQVQDASSPAFPGCILVTCATDWRWVHPKNDKDFDVEVLS